MHQKRGSQIVHNADVSVTSPNIVIDQRVVDIPPIATPRSEIAEPDPKESISELGKDTTAQATATANSQAEPRYPTRQRKAP